MQLHTFNVLLPGSVCPSFLGPRVVHGSSADKVAHFFDDPTFTHAVGSARLGRFLLHVAMEGTESPAIQAIREHVTLGSTKLVLHKAT